MLSQKIFEIRILRLARNEFHATKFPDFWNFVANSLTFKANLSTFGGLFPIPWLSRFFRKVDTLYISVHIQIYADRYCEIIR